MPKSQKKEKASATLATSAARDAVDALDEHIVVAWHEAQSFAHSRVAAAFPEIINVTQRIQKKINNPNIRKRLTPKDWKSVSTQFQSPASLCRWCEEADRNGCFEDFAMNAETEKRQLLHVYQRLCRH
jgi:hypothetical protein